MVVIDALGHFDGGNWVQQCLHVGLDWVAKWFLSRRKRNKTMHAQHGNGPGRSDGWRQVRGGQVEAKWLQEPQSVAKLREAGWRVPPDVDPAYMFRVYDTRLNEGWLKGLLGELQAPERVLMVGGDFLTRPDLEDSVAMDPTRLTRWGPSDTNSYHVVVPPRPHQASWLSRAHQQVALEGAGAEFTVCCVVPRDGCGPTLDGATVRRLLPAAGALLDDPGLEVQVLAIGERPPLQRVPAHADSRQLPPPSWESAFLAVNRVLVLVRFRRMSASGVRFQCRWIRGSPPKPPPSELELLRLEMILPPALQQTTAERAARGGLRQIAMALNLPEPPPHQLRQIVVQHGVVSGILGVPRLQAREWLRGSGCGGLYLRPFWTDSTGDLVARQNFSLLWVRGQLEQGPKLWQALWEKPGVVGLLPSGRDVAVRVTVEADFSRTPPALCIGGPTCDLPAHATRAALVAPGPSD